MYRAIKTLCLTADRTTVVDENDPRSAWLLVAKGCELPLNIAKQYGLIDSEGNPIEPESKAIEAAPENKAVIMPPENKRASQRAKK